MKECHHYRERASGNHYYPQQCKGMYMICAVTDKQQRLEDSMYKNNAKPREFTGMMKAIWKLHTLIHERVDALLRY